VNHSAQNQLLWPRWFEHILVHQIMLRIYCIFKLYHWDIDTDFYLFEKSGVKTLTHGRSTEKNASTWKTLRYCCGPFWMKTVVIWKALLLYNLVGIDCKPPIYTKLEYSLDKMLYRYFYLQPLYFLKKEFQLPYTWEGIKRLNWGVKGTMKQLR